METIDLIPMENINPDPPDKEEGSADASEPAGHQATAPLESTQDLHPQEVAEPEAKQIVSEVPPTPKRGRGRPPGSKNKTVRKATVKLEPVEPLSSVKEEIIEKPPPAEEPVISPRTRKKEYMRQLSIRRQEERKVKVAHYTRLLDRSLGY